MKKILVILLSYLMFSPIIAQEWAPVDATWHYSYYDWDGKICYTKFVVKKDTIFQDENCKKIIKENKLYCYNRSEIEYTFMRNDSVFFWDTLSNSFQLIYNFGANVGDSIVYIYYEPFNPPTNIDTVIMFVDSISSIEINSSTLKEFHVTYNFGDSSFYQSKIIENIGDIFYMFHYNWGAKAVCDGGYTTGLRCYEDSNIGFYQVEGQDSCEHYVSSVNERIKSENINIYPNPTTNKLHLQKDKSINMNSITLTNINGKHLKTYPANSTEIDISNLTKGVYLLQIETNQEIITEKVIKE